MEIRLNDLLASFEGEGLDMGTPTVFVRTQGCSIHCKWCDTPQGQSFTGGTVYDVDELVGKILNLCEKTYSYRVSFTGGNPLNYREQIAYIIKQLDEQCKKKRYTLTYNLEHPGIKTTLDSITDFDKDFFALFDSIDFDFKTPSSHIYDKYNGSFPYLSGVMRLIDGEFADKTKVSIKAVISDKYDCKTFSQVIDNCSAYIAMKVKNKGVVQKDIHLFVSPMHNGKEFVPVSSFTDIFRLNNKCMQTFGHPIRITTQIHKVLNIG